MIDYDKEYKVDGYGERKPTDRPYLDMEAVTTAEPMAMSETEPAETEQTEQTELKFT